MDRIEKSIDVNVPVSAAYNQWTQFESFPRFMEGVQDVKQVNDKLTHWKVNIGGHDREFDSEITEQIPDQVIAWRSVTPPHNTGRVTFQPLGTDQTRITLVMEYQPEGLMEKAGEMLGMTDRRVQGDLERFKDFIESRGQATGAWRGEINQGQVNK